MAKNIQNKVIDEILVFDLNNKNTGSILYSTNGKAKKIQLHKDASELRLHRYVSSNVSTLSCVIYKKNGDGCGLLRLPIESYDSLVKFCKDNFKEKDDSLSVAKTYIPIKINIADSIRRI